MRTSMLKRSGFVRLLGNGHVVARSTFRGQSAVWLCLELLGCGPRWFRSPRHAAHYTIACCAIQRSQRGDHSAQIVTVGQSKFISPCSQINQCITLAHFLPSPRSSSRSANHRRLVARSAACRLDPWPLNRVGDVSAVPSYQILHHVDRCNGDVESVGCSLLGQRHFAHQNTCQCLRFCRYFHDRHVGQRRQTLRHSFGIARSAFR